MGNIIIMKEKSIFVEFLGDSPLTRVLDFLIEMRPFETTKEEIIKETGVSRNSFFKIWKKLEKYGMVIVTRQIGKSNMYVLNDENEIVQQLLRLELTLGKMTMAQAGKEVKPIYA
jgi:transcription initiation factor IIE alpha subunit